MRATRRQTKLLHTNLSSSFESTNKLRYFDERVKNVEYLQGCCLQRWCLHFACTLQVNCLNMTALDRFYWQKTWKRFLHLRGRCVNSQPLLWIMTLFRYRIVSHVLRSGWPTDIYFTGIIQDKLGFRCIAKFRANNNLCWQYYSYAESTSFLYFLLRIEEETR